MAARRKIKAASGLPQGLFLVIGAVVGFMVGQNVLPDLRESLGPLIYDGLAAFTGAVVGGILYYLVGRGPS